MSQKVVEQQSRQADFFHLCGNCHTTCCSGVRPPITWRRKAIIENYLKTKSMNIGNPFKKSVYQYPKETHDNCCIFFDKNTTKCRVHPVKPETCVAGPITFDINMTTERIEWFLKTEKICPLAGALYRDKTALKRHLKSAREELLRLVHDLDAEALRAILKIEEPDTFKIGEEPLNVEVLAKLKASV